MKGLLKLITWEIILPKPYKIFHLSFFVIVMSLGVYLSLYVLSILR